VSLLRIVTNQQDIWEDRSRGACWLPQELFTECGFDLKALSKHQHDAAFARGLRKLIGIAQAHLRNALAYTLLLPRTEPGLRKFCLWSIGMALLTLRRIDSNPGFTSGKQVKITRRAVTGTVLLTSTLVRRDRALRWLFDLLSSRLPAPTAQLDVSCLGRHAGHAVFEARTTSSTIANSDWAIHE
jgi:farnesyl-diphosphate farnesyltransferase